jgi:hypothetical protein
MKETKATAAEHMRRDLDAGSKWTCPCEACVQIRSLVGVDKMLDVRPLVRAIEQLSAKLESLPPGPERDRAREEYLALNDQLAEKIAE